MAVKAVEENSKKLFKPIAISNANISAIGAKNDYSYIEKRADYLFNLLPESLKNVSIIERFPGNWMKISILISFIIGLLSNYLGPSQLIHVVYNPLTILLAWNILIYIIIIIKSFFKIRIPDFNKKSKSNGAAITEKTENDEKKKPSSNFILNWLIGRLYKLVIQLKSKFVDDSTKVLVLKKILPAFWNSYIEVAGKTLILRYKSLVNISATGLVLGALIGIYFRGLFYNYNMIWQSTFILEPQTIKTILNFLFGPASLLLDGNLISTEDVYKLIQPGGTAAASWIHKMALTAFIIVFIPRTLLSILYIRLSKKSTKPIDISQPYFTETILKNRESIIEIIRDGIKDIISKKIKKIGQTISDFVTTDYYEKIIEPILLDFRKKGGKITKLEDDLFESQEKFEPILLNYLQEVQEDFRESILTEINLFLGRKLEIDIDTISTYHPQSDEIDQRLPGKIASDIGDTIGGTIVTTVSLAVGSISGGIGKSLGIAIISGILGVSGPIGLLIGGIITAITLGGVYKLKRDQISGIIKDVPLPAFAIKATLTDSKLTKTRNEAHTHTEKEIKKMLHPKIDEVTNTILKDLIY